MIPLSIPDDEIPESDGEEQVRMKQTVAIKKSLEHSYPGNYHFTTTATTAAATSTTFPTSASTRGGIHNYTYKTYASNTSSSASSPTTNNEMSYAKSVSASPPPPPPPQIPQKLAPVRPKRNLPTRASPEVICLIDSDDDMAPEPEPEAKGGRRGGVKGVKGSQQQQQQQQQRQTSPGGAMSAGGSSTTSGNGGGGGGIYQLQSQKRAITPPVLRKNVAPTITVQQQQTQQQQTQQSQKPTQAFMSRAEEEEERKARILKRKAEESLRNANGGTDSGSGGDSADSTSGRPTKTSKLSEGKMGGGGVGVGITLNSSISSSAVPTNRFYATGMGRTLKGDVVPSPTPPQQQARKEVGAGHSASSSEGLGSKGSPVTLGGGGAGKELSNLGFLVSDEMDVEAETQTEPLEYPFGVVKRTMAQGVKRSGEDISIEEVLQKDYVTMAVLSAFQFNSQWILEKFNIRDTKFILVMQAKEPAEREGLERMFSVLHGVNLVFPNMSGQINCMHSKLMLLFHANHMRLVVPSANLVPYDWGESHGVMENIVFIIDLPKLPNDRALEEKELTPFARELVYFVREMGYPDRVLRALMRMDYAKTKGLAFVHSVGGSHQGERWARTGYPGLGTAVRELGLAPRGGRVEVDYVTSSVGALNKEFLGNMYRAVMGDDGLAELQSRGKKSLASAASKSGSGPMGKFLKGVTTSAASATAVAAKSLGVEGLAARKKKKEEEEEAARRKVVVTWEGDVREKFRVYFPSLEAVRDSKGGVNAGGTICFQEKWWAAETFPKSVLRECRNSGVGREGVLLHSKVLFVRLEREVEVEGGEGDETRRAQAWAYVGSANLSESAWGKLVLDRATQKPKLNVKNWECGVLVPVYSKPKPNPKSWGAGASAFGPAGSATGRGVMGGVEDTSSLSILSSIDTDDGDGNGDGDVDLPREGKAKEGKVEEAERKRTSFPTWVEDVRGVMGGKVGDGEAEGEDVDQGVPGMEVFLGRVPVPMEVPGRKFALGRRPWFYMGV